MFNYGGLGGGAASGFTNGAMRGYKFVDDMQNASLNRKIVQEQWDMEKTKRMQNIEAAQIKNSNLLQLARQTVPTFDQAGLEAIHKITMTQAEQLKKVQGKEIKNSIMELLGAVDFPLAVKQANTKMKQDPGLYSQMGLDVNAGIRHPETGSEQDRALVGRYLSKNDPFYDKMSPEGKRRREEMAMKTGSIIINGENVVDLYAASIATGAWNSAEPQKVKVAEKKIMSALDSDGIGSDTTDEYILSKELGNYKGDMYTVKSTKGSSAYGKYQIMPETAKSVAKKIGIPEDKMWEPENQEKMYTELKKEYAQTLDNLGVPQTPGNMYAVHQLGAPTAKDYFKGQMTDRLRKAMKANISNSGGMNDEELYAKWTNKYVAPGQAQPEQPTYASSQPAQPQQGVQQPQQGVQLGAQDRYQLTRELAGLSDNRTAMMQNADYISSKFGEGVGNEYLKHVAGLAEPGDVVDPLADERAGIAATMSEIHGPNWQQNPKAVEDYRQRLSNLLDKEYGAGSEGIKTKRYADVFANNYSSWQDSKASNFKVGMDPNTIFEDKVREQEILQKNPVAKKLYEKAFDQAQVYTMGKSLANRFKKMMYDGTLEKGAWGEVKKMFQQYLPEDWQSPEFRQALEANAGLSAQEKAFVLDYVRAMSGAAASDQDFTRNLETLGAAFGTQPQYQKAALEGFLGTIQMKGMGLVNQLGNQGLTGTAKEFYRALSPETKQKAEQIRETRGAAEVAKGAQQAQPTQAIEFSVLPVQLQEILFNAPEGTIVKLKDGNFVWKNKRLERVQ